MRFLQTDDRSIPLLIVRLVLGGLMFIHGSQMLFGWFGGGGPASTIRFLMLTLHLPLPVTATVIGAEFFGGLGLILGFLTRLSALGVAGVMVGAIAMVHWPNGLFMNWDGHQKGEGFEYHLLVLAICLALIIGGAGRWSLDAGIYYLRSRSRAAPAA